MRIYKTYIDNTYQTIQTPLVFQVGFINQKSLSYNCLTKLERDEFLISSQDRNVIITGVNICQTNNVGSHVIQVFDKTVLFDEPILYTFFTYQRFFVMNQSMFGDLLNRELPNIYQQANKLNDIDNVASTFVLNMVSEFLYFTFWNTATSVGIEDSYNPDYEFMYLGVYNFLQNAVFPSQLLLTLINVNTQCSIQRFSIAITLSRIIYQFLGFAIPIYIYYNALDNTYRIRIYYTQDTGWELGVDGKTELGITTILGGSTKNAFLWIIQIFLSRVMPASVKYLIEYYDFSEFSNDFDTDIVLDNDYINPDIIYDAYLVINNNNNFNTKGYLKR
jgi:hypothetical protein